MRRNYLPTALMLSLGLASLATLPVLSADKSDAARLVSQLGSSDFAEREAAARALETLGTPALEALRQGLMSNDPEVRMRSAQLIKILETRQTSAALLAPTRIRLVYKNTPLAEALADFNKKTGNTITLVDPANATRGRVVTLDTGDVTFWEALDKFCEAAGLSEANPYAQIIVNPGRPINRRPLPVQPVQPAQPVQPIQPMAQPIPPQGKQEGKPAEKPAEAKPEGKPMATDGKPGEAKPAQPKEVEVKPLPPQGARPLPAQPGRAVQMQVVQIQVQVQGPVQIQPGVMVQNGPIATPPGQGITLVDGKGPTPPTDASRSVRIRALDPNLFLGQAREKEILVGLQVTPEPRLHWQTLSGVRVTKAVDDNGQNLVQTTEGDNDPALNPGIPVNPGLGAPGLRPGGGRLRGGPLRMIPNEHVAQVRLKEGAQPSKTLKELRGVVTAQVMTDREPVITVDKVLESAGKTFKGGEGGVLRVRSVKKTEGAVEVRFEFEAPRDVATGTEAVTPQAPPAVQPVPAVRPVPAPVPDVQPGLPTPPPVVTNPTVASAQCFVLRDDQGTPLTLATASPPTTHDNPRGGIVVEYHLIYRTKSAEPASLVFLGQKCVTLEIPFSLENVPLP